MYRMLLALTLSIAAISLPAAATSAPNVTLTGVVGPGFNISLKNPDGSSVSHLDPGTYDIAVTDNAPIDHNFHLRGPGVDMSTPLEGTATVTWTVTFTDGTYTFLCDAHQAQMKGSFTVGNVPPPPPPPPPPGKLSGKVTAKAISLKTGAGAKVKTLVAKKYKLTVSDASNKQNFHLKGPGLNKKTGVAAKTRATWTVTLKPGKYTYWCDPHSSVMRGSFKVVAA
jgi:plastocyanin